MAFDAHVNFGYGVVATAPSPATSGTTLVLQTGQGALMPAVPFNATVWPLGQLALVSTAEIVRVTTIAGDTLTITRAQEGSSARTIVVGDQVAATITAKTLQDVELLAKGGDVTGPGSAAADSLTAFSGTTGKILKDASIPLSQVARRDQTNTFAQQAVFSSTVTLNGVMASSAQPRVSAWQNGIQSLTHGWNTLKFNTNDEQVGFVHDTGATSHQFTCPSAGFYLVVVQAIVQGNVTGIRVCLLTRDGVGVAQDTRLATASFASCALAVHWMGPVTSGQVFSAQFYQDTGAALSSSMGPDRANSTWFAITRLW